MAKMFSAMEKEQQALRDAQIVKYAYTFPINVAVPNNGEQSGKLVLDTDADFYAQCMTGKVIAPADSDGVRQDGEDTDFPMAGTIVGFADSGLQVEIKDKGSGRDLTDDFVNVETILTPGYGFQMYIPFSWKYYARRKATIAYQFANRDTATGEVDLYHYVALTIHGFKYTGHTK